MSMSSQPVYNPDLGLRPVMVYQLLHARQPHEGALFTIGDREVDRVTTVGSIVHKRSGKTWTMITIEDGSLYGGRINVGLSHDSDYDVSATEHVYVRATGRLKKRQLFNYLEADYIRPIEHAHEVDFHMLEVLFANMVFKRGSPPHMSLAHAPNQSSTRVGTSSAPASTAASADSAIVPVPMDTSSEMSPDEFDRELPREDSDDGHRAQLATLSDWISSGMAELSMEADSTSSVEINDRSDDTQSTYTSESNPATESDTPEFYSSGGGVRETRDPYSGLTTLQREIIRFVQSSGPPPSIYPPISGEEDDDDWIGVDANELSRLIATNHGISEAEAKTSINDLIEEGYVYLTVDNHHLNIT